jgi:hypothetical protein
MTSTSPKTGRCLETSYRLPGTRPDNRVDRPTRRGTVTPSCLPWCFFLPLFSC